MPVLNGLGGDAADFAARQLTIKIASAADLIITMTKEHRDFVLETAPRQMQRTFTLTEAAHFALNSDARTLADLASLRRHLATQELSDIPDPIGQSAAVFQAVGAQIANLLPPVLELCRRSVRP